MDPEAEKSLKDNLPALFEWVKETANTTGQFIQEQTPLLIQEYLNWVFWNNVITVFVILLFLIPSLIISVKTLRKTNFLGCFDHNWVITITFGMISFVSTMVFTIEGLSSIKEAIKVKVAPRVVIMEKLKELTK